MTDFYARAVEATYPYFIPGLPLIGTFGAVIQQKSLPPNKDALFDLGFAGSVAGFIVSIIVALIEVQLSVVISELPPSATERGVPVVSVHSHVVSTKWNR